MNENNWRMSYENQMEVRKNNLASIMALLDLMLSLKVLTRDTWVKAHGLKWGMVGMSHWNTR